MRNAISKSTKNKAEAFRESLSIADLPPTNCARWVAARKGKVVIAVNRGLLSANEACNRYGLSAEEFIDWRSSYAAHGLPGLKARGPYAGHSTPASR